MQRYVFALSCLIFFDALANLPQHTDNTHIKQPGLSVNSDKVNPPSSSSPSPFAQVQSLRQAGRLSEAETLAKNYVLQHPNDGDMLFLLGLVYFQEKNFHAATTCFNTVLAQTPTYMDARIALIRIKIIAQEFQEASNLIDIGLNQNPKQQELIELKATILQQESVLSAKNQISSIPNVSIANIQALRQQGKLELAKKEAMLAIKANPKDLDMQVILGFIYLQQKDYTNAETLLKSALTQKPDYLDARIGLIKLRLIQHQFEAAKDLISQGIATNPDKHQPLLLLKKQLATLIANKTPRAKKSKHEKPLSPEKQELLRAKNDITQKKYKEAGIILQKLVTHSPNNSIAQADFYLAQHRDMKALNVIRKGLKNNPYNTELLIEEGSIHNALRQYPLAAHAYQQAKKTSPNDKRIDGLLSEIDHISPHYSYGLNEIGMSTDNAYVSDVHSIWDWSSIYYSRDTAYGVATARLNYAFRLHQGTPQYEFDFSPRFNRNIYADLSIAFAKQPAIFPDFSTYGEAYVNIPQFFELSGGAKYAKIAQTFYASYTGSINFYPKGYWISFRPIYFVPKGRVNTSLLYTARARKYLGDTLDSYIGIGVGSGQSPDLADLLSVSFIVIKNNFINASYGFPIFNHQVLVELGAGYQRWQYPTNLIRNLYDGSITFKYRF